MDDDHLKLHEDVDEIEATVKTHEPREVIGKLLQVCAARQAGTSREKNG